MSDQALFPTPSRNIEVLADLAQGWITDTIADVEAEHEVVAVCALYSGGTDSTVLAHLARRIATTAVHINTGIGIESTRQYVRDRCAEWGLPLIERRPPDTYRDLVLERGFPGPAMHWKMYTRLKERALMQVRRELVTNPRKQRVVFLAGRRRSESQRRRHIPMVERRGSIVWLAPIAEWSKLDVTRYLAAEGIEPCLASRTIHMSGECLCGAFAKPNELDEIGFWFPDTAEEIRALEAEVRAGGIPEPYCRWGHGQGRPSDRQGPLCASCQFLPGFTTEVDS